MKKIFCALILVLCVVTPSFSASRQEMKRMSTFLSNFTELGMYNFNVDTVPSGELVRFGIWHNYINNNKSRIEECPRGRNCQYGYSVINKKYVAESVKKYFDIDLEHESIENGHYDGRYYHFMPADGEIPYYADVQEVSSNSGIITMRGELYSSEDEDDRPATFTARAKPYRFNGRDTWSILTMTTKWRE